MKKFKTVIFTLAIALVAGSLTLAMYGTSKVSIIAKAEDSSPFSFVKINETECDVRLVDKTVSLAIVPDTAIIDGKEYTVTTVTSFGNATNLKKVRLPESVKTISGTAFFNCTALKSITLPAVEEIGSNAFANTGLDYLIIPETVTSVGATILRLANTQVYVREPLAEGSSTPAGTWASNWNENNSNQNVIYNSDFLPEVEYTLIEIQSGTAQGGSGSNNIQQYYIVSDYQEFVYESGDIYIPATKDDIPVVGISNYAFFKNSVNKITVGYSESPLYLSDRAFTTVESNTIIINRDIVFCDYELGEPSVGVFEWSSVSTVILPNTLTAICDYMFNGCMGLKDVHFITPSSYDSEEQEMNLDFSFDSTHIVELPETENLTTIGTEAFSGVYGIIKISIPQNIINVGQNAFAGWDSQEENVRIIQIDFTNESSLPMYNSETNTGWQPLWDNGCSEDVIEYGELQEYTITYILQSGASHGNPLTFNRRDEIQLENAYLEGYTFIGWYSNSQYTGDIVTTIQKGTKESIVLYGRFTPNTYSVRYNPDRPIEASSQVNGYMNNSTFIYGESGVLTTCAYTLLGWEFVGWQDSAGNTYNNEVQVINLTSVNNGIVDLYAKWEAKYYRNTYVNKPSNASGILSGLTEDSCHQYDSAKNLSKNNYSYADEQSVINIPGGATGDVITLYAQWEANTYYINYISNTPSGTSPVSGGMSLVEMQYDTEGTISSCGYLIVAYAVVFFLWICRGYT